jgi:metal transporter CNNM
MDRLLSGYSRFPVHEPGNPLSFSGLLLVKKVGPRSSAIFANGRALTTRLTAAHLRSVAMLACVQIPSFNFARSKANDQLFSGTRLLVRMLHNGLGPRTELTYSQTGRAHLLLISNTPGSAGGAIGVITLEGTV